MFLNIVLVCSLAFCYPLEILPCLLDSKLSRTHNLVFFLAATKRTRAYHTADVTNTRNQGGSWLEHPPVRSSANVFEEGCIICFEEMTRSTALKLHCGHMFHRNVSKQQKRK